MRPIVIVPSEESEEESKGLASKEDAERDYKRDSSNRMPPNHNILDEFPPMPEFAIQPGSQKISSTVLTMQVQEEPVVVASQNLLGMDLRSGSSTPHRPGMTANEQFRASGACPKRTLKYQVI